MPIATIGIPVYQGENYLDETLQAARAQDYGALEIVVADNASTDATPEIIASHVAVDDRVRVITNLENLGAAENYNIAFRESRGKYFAWNAHDDYTSPDFISEGVKVLENDPTAVIAFGRLVIVDAIGQRREDKELPVPEGLRSPSPAVRFRATARGAPEIVVFGLIRSSTLKTTDLHGAFTGSDRNLVAELMLHGTAVQAGDSEFYLRHHDQRSVRLIAQAESRFSHPREAWFAPQRAGKIVFPGWRRLGGYIEAVRRSKHLSPAERMACYWAIVQLLVDDRMKLSKYLVKDIITALLQVAGPRSESPAIDDA